MKTILFGGMALWKKGMDLINQYHPQFELRGFCTAEDNELTRSNPLVYTLEELVELYAAKTVEAVILIDGSQQAWIRVFREKGIDRIYGIPSKYLMMETIPDHEKGNLVCEADDLPSELSQLEIHLADHCNLNCKGCAHFSNLVQEEVFPDLSTFEKDIQRLSELFDNIREFFFLGGEPLLNPQVKDFLYAYRKAFPYSCINLVTNGLLILVMDEDLIRAVKETGCKLNISNYNCLDSERIVRFLEEKGLSYDLRQGKGSFTKYLNSEGNGDEDVFRHCGRKWCTFLRDGRIAACSQPFTIRYFNRYFHTHFSEEGSFSLYEDLNGKEMLRRLQQPMEACKYCTYDMEYTWDSGVTPDVSDWCVK